MITSESISKLELSRMKKKLEIPAGFLDREDLAFIEKMRGKALKAFAHHEQDSLFFRISTVVELYLNLLTIPENRSVSAIALLAILLRTLAENPKLNSFEKETFMVLSMRCFSYAWNYPCMNVPVLSQQDKSKNSFSFSDENRISELEGIRKVFLMDESLIGDVDPDTRKRLALLRNAYHEGRKHLTKKSLKVLNELMQRTSRDSLHNEFFATGYSDNDWISEIQKGFIKEDGLKSTNPVYDYDEDVVYHSHPDLSPLSINGNSYDREDAKGDIGHALKGRKKVFVINTRGDIFYTNPVVVDACFGVADRCESGLSQVFLGNIKDFQ